MPHPPGHAIAFDLDLCRFADLESLACARCSGGEGLDLHQPDPARPVRLLATCGTCGAWYLVSPELPAGPPEDVGDLEAASEGPIAGLMLRLPTLGRASLVTPHRSVPAHHLRAAGP